MKKPRVNTSPTANFYAAPNERIIEVTGQDGIGCLIAIRNLTGGTVLVQVYRADPGIQLVGPDNQPEARPDPTLPMCTYGRAASCTTPCTGPVDQALVYRSSLNGGKVLDRTAQCRGHADEALDRARRAGTTALLALEPLRSADEMLPDITQATGLTEDPTDFNVHTYQARRNAGELRWQVFRDADTTPCGFLTGSWCVDGNCWHLTVEDAGGKPIGDPGKRSDHACVMSYHHALHWIWWASEEPEPGR